jgi:hypothetical protein
MLSLLLLTETSTITAGLIENLFEFRKHPKAPKQHQKADPPSFDEASFEFDGAGGISINFISTECLRSCFAYGPSLRRRLWRMTRVYQLGQADPFRL